MYLQSLSRYNHEHHPDGLSHILTYRERERERERDSLFFVPFYLGIKNIFLAFALGRPSFLQDTTLHSHNSPHTTLHGPILHTHNSIRHNSTRHNSTRNNSTHHNSTRNISTLQFDASHLDPAKLDTTHLNTSQLDTSKPDMP